MNQVPLLYFTRGGYFRLNPASQNMPAFGNCKFIKTIEKATTPPPQNAYQMPIG